MNHGHHQYTERSQIVPTEEQAREVLARNLAGFDQDRADSIRSCPLMDVALGGREALEPKK